MFRLGFRVGVPVAITSPDNEAVPVKWDQSRHHPRARRQSDLRTAINPSTENGGAGIHRAGRIFSLRHSAAIHRFTCTSKLSLKQIMLYWSAGKSAESFSVVRWKMPARVDTCTDPVQFTQTKSLNCWNVVQLRTFRIIKTSRILRAPVTPYVPPVYIATGVHYHSSHLVRLLFLKNRKK